MTNQDLTTIALHLNTEDACFYDIATGGDSVSGFFEYVVERHPYGEEDVLASVPSPCQMHDMEDAELPEPDPQINDDAIAWHSGENVGALADWRSVENGGKKEVAESVRPTPWPPDGILVRALAVMEKAIQYKVSDPVAFTLDVLKDGRI